jgi:hypothetical protein
MNMQTLKSQLIALNRNEHRTIYTSPLGVRVTVKHTARHSPKDFAVGIWGPEANEFYPTHGSVAHRPVYKALKQFGTCA